MNFIWGSSYQHPQAQYNMWLIWKNPEISHIIPRRCPRSNNAPRPLCRPKGHSRRLSACTHWRGCALVLASLCVWCHSWEESVGVAAPAHSAAQVHLISDARKHPLQFLLLMDAGAARALREHTPPSPFILRGWEHSRLLGSAPSHCKQLRSDWHGSKGQRRGW